MPDPIPRSSSTQLRLNAASGAVGTIVSGCTVLLSYPIYLHYLGYEKLGVWVAMTTVLSIAQLANLGLGAAVTKLVAEEFGRHDPLGVRRYVAMATLTVGASGILVFLAILLLRDPLVALFNLHGDDAALARSILPYVGLITIYYFLVDVAASVLTGLGRMDLGTYARAAGRLFDLAFSILLLARGMGVLSLLISDAVSLVGIHLAILLMARLVVDFNPFALFAWDRRRFSHLLRFGGGVFGNSLLSMLLAPLNKIVLSRFVGVQSLPVYEMAQNGAGLIRSMADAPLRAIMPEISRIWSARSADAVLRVRQIYWRSVKAVVWLGLPMYGVILLCDKPLLRLWLRHRYTDSLPIVFNILLLGAIINMLAIPAYYALMGAGRIRTCFVTHLIGALANVLWLGILAALAKVTLPTVAWGSVIFAVVTGAFLAWKVAQAFGLMLASCEFDAIVDDAPAQHASAVPIS